MTRAADNSWGETALAGFWLNNNGGEIAFWDLREKIYFWACLLGSGFKFISRWNIMHLSFLSQYLNQYQIEYGF